MNLPVVVVHLTMDGVVLHCNPEAVRVTGYSEAELVGKNFWALMFPGRLFVQVPKFISAVHPVQVLMNDVPMTMRTREGKERVIAWTRFAHEESVGSSGEANLRSMICVGKDLTDRLVDADNAGQPEKGASGQAGGALSEMTGVFGPRVGNGGTVDGDVVTPIAISPRVPLPAENGTTAIQQVHEFLEGMDGRVAALESALFYGELANLALIAEGLSSGAHACGLLDFSTSTEELRKAATLGEMQQVTNLVNEIVSMCRTQEK